MKKRLATGTALLMSFGLVTAVQAQDVEARGQAAGVEGKAEINLPDDRKELDSESRITYRDEREQKSRVSSVDKASSVIGMEVKNQQGETLGEIQDIVINWSDGSISYAVLSVGGFLGLGEKYIAVPPSAFSMDRADNRLVLNVDKAKVEQAPGFAKTNWPDVENPAWGAAADWGKPSGDSEIGVRGEIGRDRDVNVQADIDRDRSSRDDTEIRARGDLDRGADLNIRAGERQGQSAVDQNRDAGILKGRVTAVDVENRTITVAGDSGTETFKMAERPTLTVHGNRNPSIVDFKVGYNVTVEYDHQNGEMVARKVIQTSPTELK